MGAKLGGGEGGAVGDINVTPLIDVVLVLLIIFMVVTPMLSNNVPLNLPKAGSPVPHTDKGDNIVISIDANGDIFMGKDQITEDEVIERVNLAYQENAYQAVLIRGDSSLHYGQVRAVMDILGESGMPNIQLAVDRPKGE
ncbi:MAG: biopolymer transporter ExbD [Myxococcota bacterium]|nr:biopolymer transporter ExbD [Myxococcota bacterium]